MENFNRTVAAIGVYRPDDTVQAVWCLNRGGIIYTGARLEVFYNQDYAKDLISRGNIDTLRMYQQVTTYCGRDLGEYQMEPQILKSAEHLFKNFDGAQYFYVIKDNTWYVSNGPGTGWDFLENRLSNFHL